MERTDIHMRNIFESVLIHCEITLSGQEFLDDNCFEVTYPVIKDKTQLAVQVGPEFTNTIGL